MIEILRITAPFGIKGAVRVCAYTNDLKKYQNLFEENGTPHKFKIVKSLGSNNLVISLDSSLTRNDAEKLRGTTLYINREDLQSVGDNTFYVCDLIGQDVKVEQSDIKLKISDVQSFGAGDLIELSDGEKTFFVPFTKDNFPEIDGKTVLTREAYEGFKN